MTAIKALHVGLSLTQSVGGQGESIRHFQQALGGTITSFSHQWEIEQRKPFLRDVIHIPVGDDLISKAFMRPQEAVLGKLESLVSEHSLIIVNLLYRYHVHWAVSAARRHKIPYWIVTHGGLDPYVFGYRATQKKLWLRFWGRQFLADADKVLFATQKERQKAEAIYSGENTRVISWPVEIRDMNHRPNAQARLRARFNVPKDSRVLLFLGRYEAMKRPLETMAIFAASNVENVILLMVGIEEQYSTSELLEYAAKLGISHKVRVTGPVYGREKDELLLGADGFISLSWRENFGYTTAEALSAGTPVILSPGNDLCSTIRDVDCGWLIQDAECKGAIDAIREFSEVPMETLGKMGISGHQLARKEFRFSEFRRALLAEI